MTAPHTVSAWLAMLGTAAMALAAAEGGGPFRLDSDEFPIGMFSVDSPGAMAQVAKMGVGYVHTYAGGRSADPEGIARDRSYLDAAQANGLRVMVNLNGRSWAGKADGVAALTALATALKDHPALGFWYLYDEPDGHHTAEQLKPFYEALRALTPQVPVAIATAWSKGWAGHTSVLDLQMIDIYPVNHEPFPAAKLDQTTKFTDAALRLGRPVIPINQCFNWKALAGTQEVYRGGPVGQLRYPNPAELRYWCYSGACQGVRGMFWWSYARSIAGGYGWIGRDFATVLREFAEFSRLAAPLHRPLVFERARDNDVFMARWQRPTGDYIVLINAWPLARPIERWTEDRLAEARLLPWGSTRPVPARVQGGRLSVDQAEPWETFVWQVAAP